MCCFPATHHKGVRGLTHEAETNSNRYWVEVLGGTQLDPNPAKTVASVSDYQRMLSEVRVRLGVNRKLNTGCLCCQRVKGLADTLDIVCHSGSKKDSQHSTTLT